MLTSVTPEVARQADTTLLKAILADAAKRLNDGQITDKLVAAELHFVVGETYLFLSDFDAAMVHILKSLEIRKQELGPRHRDTLITTKRLASIYMNDNRLANAETLYEEILPIMKEELGEDNTQTLGAMTNLVITYGRQGRFADCETLAVETLEIQKQALGEDSSPARLTMNALANVYAITGQLDKSKLLYKTLVELNTRKLGQDSPETLPPVFNLAITYSLQNRYEEAIELLKPRLMLFRNVMGQQKEFVTNFQTLLAKVYVGAIEIDDARSLCQETLKTLAPELEGATQRWSSSTAQRRR